MTSVLLVTSYLYRKTFPASPLSRATPTVAMERKNGNGAMEWRNGNGGMAMEWWKPGIVHPLIPLWSRH